MLVSGFPGEHSSAHEKRHRCRGGVVGSRRATLDDLRKIADSLPGSEERATTGGTAWFVRRKPYAWECRPRPSIPDDIRAILATELVVAVKVADQMDGFALIQMEPDVFLRTTTPWGDPEVAFRLAAIKPDHLAELVTDAWRAQAPRYLRHELDAAAHDAQPTWPDISPRGYTDGGEIPEL